MAVAVGGDRRRLHVDVGGPVVVQQSATVAVLRGMSGISVEVDFLSTSIDVVNKFDVEYPSYIRGRGATWCP